MRRVSSSLRGRALLKWTLGTCAALVLCVGLLIGAFQLAVAQVPGYRVQLQSWISERTGLVVEFGTLSARLRRYGPELVFDDAIVRTPDRAHVLAAARRGALAFDVWASLGSGRLTAGRFSLDAPQLGLIRTREGRIQLVGQSALPEHDGKPFALEHLPVGQYRVRDAHVTFRDEATGRGPWALSGVSFAVNRRVDLLELDGYASLPRSLGSELEFTARAQGPLEELATLSSSFTVTGADLDLAGWAALFPDEWPAPEIGRGSLRVSGRFAGAVLSAASVEVDFREVAAVPPQWSEPLPVALPLTHPGEDEAVEDEQATLAHAPEERGRDSAPGDPGLLSYDRVAFNLRAQRLEGGWRMSLQDLDLTRRDAPWQADDIEAEWRRSAGGGSSVSGKADRLVLENLWPLLAYVPESAELAHLRALHAGGTIRDLVVSVQREAAQSPFTYSLQAQLEDMRFAPVKKAPGLSGISGHVRATHEGGSLQLADADVEFDLPRLFREPLHAGEIAGVLAWEHTAEGWRIASDELLIDNADAQANARFAMTLPGDGSSPVLDLTAEGRDIDAAATRKYLPAGRLSIKALAWLDDAFVRGRVPHAELTYRGPVRSFPFRDQEGLFLVRGRVEGMTFDYQHGWTQAQALAAEFEFRNEGLQVRAGAGTVGGLRLQNAAADLPDFKEGQLAIRAEGSGDLAQALDYLQSSPLGPVLGEEFAKLDGSGELRARVDLRLPLKNLEERAVKVHASLDDAQIRMADLDAPLTGLAGTLTVHHTGVEAADLQGRWLGGPLALHVHRPTVGSAPQLLAQGTSLAAELEPLLNLPDNVKLEGSAHWRAEIPLAGTSRPQHLFLHSDLRELAIGLPAPLGKQAGQVRRLRIELESAGDSRLLTRVTFGDVRGLLLLRRGTEEGWQLDRGSIRPDGLAAALPDHAGLRLEGSLEHFKLDDWLALRAPAASGEGRVSDYLRAANLRIGKLELFGYEWSDVRGLLHATPGGWRVNVAGPMAEGELSIPYDLAGAAPLTAKLEHLSIARRASEEAAGAGKVRDPRQLPAIEASIGELHVGASRIGALELKVVRVPEGVRVETLTAAGTAFQGNVRGHWLRTATGEQSRLEARLASTDVGATLRAFGYPGFMEAKHGEILADLSWLGGFDEDFLGRASGTVAVSAENGQLLNLQPGAGRLLGLFSVAALPRRLALDFSDLTDKGLSFDNVHGDFELRKGDAYTGNLLLRGPAAEIGIAGRTGLGTQDYDQTAVVTGNLGASLPVAGALAGGPAVGAALLLFSQMFKEPLKGITRGYYRITGTWENPVVERVDAAGIKGASARINPP